MTTPFSVSYGQNAEDVVLHRALADVEEGFYVEVGANEPTELSISRAFYDAGWHGIEIEPVEQLARDFASARPRDVVVQAAITNADVTTVTLHAIEGTGLSTLDDGISERHRAGGYPADDVEVPALRLSDVLAEHGAPQDIHFMVVDTEGTEADVLASMDWSRWRPWILVIEATQPLSKIPSHEQWEPALLDNGYEFCFFDGISRFYVAAEHADRLREKLSYPANVLDGYTAREIQLRDIDLEAARARVAALEDVVERTRADLVRWRGSVLARWTDAVASGAGPNGTGGHEVTRLRDELDAVRATLSWRVTAPLRRVQERRLRGWR